MLPCSPDQFSSFISGLLGKPQTITQSMRGAFDISAIELMNIHQLIDQRIRQQNQGELIQFTVRIIFGDDSSVLLSSFEDLQHYNEVRPVVSKQVHLSWSYLIRFADRSFPEKQSIDLSFLSGPALQIDENDLIQILANRKANNVVFRIQHTARTWGADIQSLLENHLIGLIAEEGATKRFVRNHSTKIQLAMFSFIMISVLFSIFRSAKFLAEECRQTIGQLLLKKVGVEMKLDGVLKTLGDHYSSNFQLYSVGYIIAGFVFSLFLCIIFESAMSSSKPSFIRLTPMSDRYRQNILYGYRKQWFTAGASIVSGVLTGLVSSIIYANFWGA